MCGLYEGVPPAGGGGCPPPPPPHPCLPLAHQVRRPQDQEAQEEEEQGEWRIVDEQWKHKERGQERKMICFLFLYAPSLPSAPPLSFPMPLLPHFS